MLGALLAPLEEYLGDFEVARDYRIVTDERCNAGIYIQGFSQASHGLSDTLLSVLPARAAEIGQALYQDLAQRCALSGQSQSLAHKKRIATAINDLYFFVKFL